MSGHTRTVYSCVRLGDKVIAPALVTTDTVAGMVVAVEPFSVETHSTRAVSASIWLPSLPCQLQEVRKPDLEGS